MAEVGGNRGQAPKDAIHCQVLGKEKGAHLGRSSGRGFAQQMQRWRPPFLGNVVISGVEGSRVRIRITPEVPVSEKVPARAGGRSERHLSSAPSIIWMGICRPRCRVCP